MSEPSDDERMRVGAAWLEAHPEWSAESFIQFWQAERAKYGDLEADDHESIAAAVMGHFGLNAASRDDTAVYLGLYRLYIELLEGPSHP